MRLIFALLGPLLTGPVQGQDRDLEKAYRTLEPSVVALKNAEGYGSGILLDESGLILTNAHVMVSPLPFQILVDAVNGDEIAPCVYKNVQFLGVDPTYDLALVKIDPAENRARLVPAKLASGKSRKDDRVYAMGFPITSGWPPRKTLSAGAVSATERPFERLYYTEFTAPVAPGNSGGPLFDPDGRVVGVVTFKINGDKAVGLAIPIEEFNPRRFIPLSRRGKDPTRAYEILRTADQYMKQAKGKERSYEAAMAFELYRTAVTVDFGNPEIYFSLALLYRDFGMDVPEAAYLVRALRLQPWCESRGDAYHELGAALARLGMEREARAAWKEGIAKYASQCGKIWEDLAAYMDGAGKPLEAAYASRAAIKAGCDRAPAMNEIYRKARGALSPEQAQALYEREREIEKELQQGREAAEKARNAGKDFIERDFAEFVKSCEGVQPEAATVDFSRLEMRRGASTPPPASSYIPETEVAARFIRARIYVAVQNKERGATDKAVKALEEVLRGYPDHPETKEARRLLEGWK